MQTGVENPVQLILPSKGVDELTKILTDQDQDLVLHLAGNHLRLDLSGDRCAFHTMLVDGKYPDYRTVVPTERKLQAEVSREALIKAAERITPVTDELTQAVILIFKEGENLEIGAKNNKGDIGEEQIEMTLSREPGAEEEVKISINIKYLIEALQSLGSTEAVLGINDGGNSMLIRPQVGSSKHIIMPLKA